MSSHRNSDTVSNAEGPQEAGTHNTSGWTTDTKLVREFDRPANVGDATVSVIDEAVLHWPGLSEKPPLSQFVDVEKLNGLFKTKAVDDDRRAPSMEFQFQDCRVTLLYGSSVLVIIERDP